MGFRVWIIDLPAVSGNDNWHFESRNGLTRSDWTANARMERERSFRGSARSSGKRDEAK